MSKKPSKSLAQELDRYITPFRYDGSGKFHLKDYKTNEKGDLDKEKALEILDANKKRMIEFQEKLYAQDRWSVLIVLQAMDAGGKDSAIKAIFEGINPQGCEVHAFKAPSTKELDHDFLWRHAIALPERGHIGIFNRSHITRSAWSRGCIRRFLPSRSCRKGSSPRTSGRSGSRTSPPSSATSAATARWF
ncbi:polyphosphate kinase 2 (PPK2 family) [Bradyrhizobium sp. S3.14.4]